MKTYLIILVIFYLLSCNNSTEPIIEEINSGIKGIVTDTSGQALENVKVYCLYYINHIPNNNKIFTFGNKLLKPGVFEFDLEQNFPNPFSNSTFLRYSVAEKSLIKITINSKNDMETITIISDSLEPGYYQQFLYNIIDSLRLKNGPYQYIINAFQKDTLIYSKTRELFIISDIGEPNSTTDNQGNYIFDYNDSFEGDTIVIKQYEYSTYTIDLSNKVYLLFIKEGYLSKTIYVTLYQNILQTQDIVLFKEK